MASPTINQLLLFGDKTLAGQFVPLAKHRAKLLAKNIVGNAVLTQKLVIPGGWIVIKSRKGRNKITIYAESGVAVQYEFFTSEGILSDLLASPPYDSGSIYGTFVCGRGSNHVINKSSLAIESVPLVELCGTCDTEPVDPLVPDVYPWPLFSGDDITGEELMRTHYAWQNQRSHEYVWWPNNKGDYFVTSAAGAVPCYNSVNRLSRFNHSNGDIAYRFIEDTGFDLRPSLYSYGSPDAVAHGAPNLADPQWWRRACIQVVDGRTFFIMNDAVGIFYFWEAGLFEGVYVPYENVLTVTLSYPVWVDGGLALWSYNKDGTKAACCPHHKQPCPNTEGGDFVYKDAGRGYVRVTPDTAPGYYVDASEDEPGLLEVEIGITIAPNGDWTPSVEITRAITFSLTGHYFVGVDYLFNDDRLGYPEDSLVVMTFDSWIKDGNYFHFGAPTDYYPDNFGAIVREAIVMLVMEDDIWHEVRRIPVRHDVLIEASGLYGYTDGVNYTGWGDTISAVSITNFAYGAVVAGVNLRNLSFVVRHQIPIDPNTTSNFYIADEVFAYNESVDTQGDPQALIVPEWSTTGFTRTDDDKLEIWGNEYHSTFDPYPAVSMSVHPNGHWAIATPMRETPSGNKLYTDVVSYRINKTDYRTTHQALYNAAFADNRDADYYINLGNLPGDVPPGQDAPLGTFKTFGIFRDK